MSDDDLQSKVAELESRVAELEERISGNNRAQSDLIDRYDTYVMDVVESPESTHPRKLMRKYNEAGVTNKNKQKRRAKRLKRSAAEGKL